jgi:rod shape-determining protein MreC
MFDPNSPELTPPIQPLPHEGPRVQAFIAGHRAFFILVAVLLAQLLFLSIQITRNRKVRLIRVWAVAVLDPFERSMRGILDVSTQAWRTYRDLWHAQQQNQELHLQLLAAQSQLQRLSGEGAESQRLRVLLDFRNRLPYQTVAAEVIATSPGENPSAIFIDKGSDAGLAADLAVITPSGVVGKILAVFPRTAQVLLITDPSSGVGVALERSRVQGVLKGAAQNLCQLHYVMNEERVSPGETVVTSGLDQVYPKGLPVGTVIQTSEGNIYKKIVVKPAAELNRLEVVLVLLNPNASPQQALNLPAHP